MGSFGPTVQKAKEHVLRSRKEVVRKRIQPVNEMIQQKTMSQFKPVEENVTPRHLVQNQRSPGRLAPLSGSLNPED